MMNKETLFILFTLKIRNGDYTYKYFSPQTFIVDTNSNVTSQIYKLGVVLASTFYMHSDLYKEGDWHYFHNGKVAVQYSTYNILSKEIYDIITPIILP